MTPAGLPSPNPPRRSLLVHGLLLTLRRPGAVLWTYAANLTVALLFGLGSRMQLASLLDHSLAAQRLTGAFDLGVAAAAIDRIGRDTPSAGLASWTGVPIDFLICFLLVPGTLFCFQTSQPARLRTLLGEGLRFFWRFVRITLLTALVSLLVLGPLTALDIAWNRHIDATTVGWLAPAFEAAGTLVLILVASLLRLYFDLVEAYTVQLDRQPRRNGKPDRRVRRTLLPALRALGRNLPRAYGTFVLLLALGVALYGFATLAALHRLARPTTLPLFLLLQLGVLCLIGTRVWQRAAQCVLAADNPNPPPALQPNVNPNPSPAEPPLHNPADAQPDPEPIAPSLDHPDPGVFHHTPGNPTA